MLKLIIFPASQLYMYITHDNTAAVMRESLHYGIKKVYHIVSHHSIISCLSGYLCSSFFLNFKKYLHFMFIRGLCSI